MTTPSFHVWRASRVDGHCVVKQAAGIRDDYELDAGVSRIDGWPSTVVCAMSPEFPKDIQIPDCFFGVTWTLVSGSLHRLLLAHGGPRVEYLPVQIADHKGRIAASDCVIVNPLAVVDAIDQAASGITWNAIQDDLIDGCDRLVIDEARVPRELQLFRLRHLEFAVIVRAELAERVLDAGAVGFAPKDPADYRGL